MGKGHRAVGERRGQGGEEGEGEGGKREKGLGWLFENIIRPHRCKTKVGALWDIGER